MPAGLRVGWYHRRESTGVTLPPRRRLLNAAEKTGGIRRTRKGDPKTKTEGDEDSMDDATTCVERLGRALRASKLVQVGEIVAVFLVAVAAIAVGAPLVGDDPLARQSVVWFANVLMLGTVWAGLHLRGQGWSHFGLRLRLLDRRTILRALLQSVAVAIAAVAAFAAGAIVMANIVGMPESADLSGYNYLQGNLPMLLLALLAVYFVSSLGEEVVYRGFLITRIAELGSGGKTARRLAVVISAIIFGFVHFEWGPAGIVQTAGMGLALGASYLLVGRNLWVTILAHGYLDTILLVPQYWAEAPGASP